MSVITEINSILLKKSSLFIFKWSHERLHLIYFHITKCTNNAIFTIFVGTFYP